MGYAKEATFALPSIASQVNTRVALPLPDNNHLQRCLQVNICRFRPLGRTLVW
jgi:hypothetical protein